MKNKGNFGGIPVYESEHIKEGYMFIGVDMAKPNSCFSRAVIQVIKHLCWRHLVHHWWFESFGVGRLDDEQCEECKRSNSISMFANYEVRLLDTKFLNISP